MFQDKVLIIKLLAVDGLAAGAVVVSEVASLAHELRNNTVEAAALVAKAFFMSAQAAEVLYRKYKNIIITVFTTVTLHSTFYFTADQFITGGVFFFLSF